MRSKYDVSQKTAQFADFALFTRILATQGNVAEVVVESSLRVNSKTAKRTKRDPAQVLPAHLEYLSSLPLNR